MAQPATKSAKDIEDIFKKFRLVIGLCIVIKLLYVKTASFFRQMSLKLSFYKISARKVTLRP